MSPTHEPFDELAARYALGALDGDDLARFEAHVARGCAECERALAEYREALVGPAADLREVPPPRVKRALMERLARSRARRPRPARLGPGLKWVASVAVAAGLIASVVATYVSARYEQRLGEMAREASALREQISQQRQALALLRDPAARIITLAGLEPSPAAQGRMIWNAHDGACRPRRRAKPTSCGRSSAESRFPRGSSAWTPRVGGARVSSRSPVGRRSRSSPSRSSPPAACRRRPARCISPPSKSRGRRRV